MNKKQSIGTIAENILFILSLIISYIFTLNSYFAEFPYNIIHYICMFLLLTSGFVFCIKHSRKAYPDFGPARFLHIPAAIVISVVITVVFYFIDCAASFAFGRPDTFKETILKANDLFVSSFHNKNTLFMLFLSFSYGVALYALIYFGKKHHWEEKIEKNGLCL